MRKPKATTGKAVRDGLASNWSSPGRTRVQGSVPMRGSAEGRVAVSVSGFSGVFVVGWMVRPDRGEVAAEAIAASTTAADVVGSSTLPTGPAAAVSRAPTTAPFPVTRTTTFRTGPMTSSCCANRCSTRDRIASLVQA